MQVPTRYSVKTPIFLLLILSLSCQKSNDEPAKTRTELISSGSWHLVSHTTNPPVDLDGDGADDDTDVLMTYENCEKDDLTIFSSNGTGTFDEGPSRCSSSDPQTIPFSWQWKSNESIISV